MSDKKATDEANSQPFYDSDEARRFIASQTGERLGALIFAVEAKTDLFRSDYIVRV